MNPGYRPQEDDAEPAEHCVPELEGLPDERGPERRNEFEPLLDLVMVFLALNKPPACNGLVARSDVTNICNQTTIWMDWTVDQGDDRDQLDVGLPGREGNEPQGKGLAHGKVQEAVPLIESNRVDNEIDVRTENTIPLVDKLQKPQRIQLLAENTEAGERWDSAERVDEEGVWCKVVVQRSLLFGDGSGAECFHHTTDLVNWTLHGAGVMVSTVMSI